MRAKRIFNGLIAALILVGLLEMVTGLVLLPLYKPSVSDAYNSAIAAYQAELALSPVTPQSTALTGDQANNSKVHWELAQVYEALGQNSLAVNELQSYLLATQWHSDVYPWRIALARNQIQTLARRR